MNKQKEINHILDIYRTNRYEIISENIMRVDIHEVIKKLRNNKTLYTCTCDAQDKSDNSIFCRHKQFFLMFPLLNFIYPKLNELLLQYHAGKSTLKDKAREVTNMIINDLDNLKRAEL